MTDKLNLPRRYRDQLEALLREHVPDAEVWAYGSRVTGKSHDGSDLDLVLRSPTLEPLAEGFFDLLEAIEKSNIPILVQAHDWARLPESFHREIERDYIVVQQGAKQATGGWQEASLGEVIELKRGYDLPQRKRIPGSVPLVSSSGVTYYHTEAKVRGPGVVTGRYGTLGEVFFVSSDFWPLNTTLYVRDFKGNDPRFISYFLRELDFSAYSDKAAVPGLNRNHLHQAAVRYPADITEQRAIAHILGTLDDKIELNRRMNQTLEQMARAIFQDWFVDFGPVRAKLEGREPYLPRELWDLFPDRMVDSELGEIPEGWGVKKLGDCIELAYGKALKAGDRKGGDVPVYGSNGQVGWHNEKLVDGPGIVVGRKGNPGVVTWSYTDFFPIDTAFYVVPRGSNLKLGFLFLALIGQDLPAVSADSAVPGLNRNLAYMNRQIIADRMTMDAFSSYADAIFARRHCLEEESRALAAQQDALLPKLLSGELQLEQLK